MRHQAPVGVHIPPTGEAHLREGSRFIWVYKLHATDIAETKDIPLPGRIRLAKRSGRFLCIADDENYNMIDLETASFLPLLPVSQAPPEEPSPGAPQTPAVKPFILVISDSEFLILSWTGASTLGLFITGEGEPVRGTLEWAQHPISVGTCSLLASI